MQSGNAATFVPVIPAERAGLRPASVSRNPVTKAVRALTPAVDYWVPARASPVKAGSFGRDDIPHAIALPTRGLCTIITSCTKTPKAAQKPNGSVRDHISNSQ